MLVEVGTARDRMTTSQRHPDTAGGFIGRLRPFTGDPQKFQEEKVWARSSGPDDPLLRYVTIDVPAEPATPETLEPLCLYVGAATRRIGREWMYLFSGRLSEAPPFKVERPWSAGEIVDMATSGRGPEQNAMRALIYWRRWVGTWFTSQLEPSTLADRLPVALSIWGDLGAMKIKPGDLESALRAEAESL